MTNTETTPLPKADCGIVRMADYLSSRLGQPVSTITVAALANRGLIRRTRRTIDAVPQTIYSLRDARNIPVEVLASTARREAATVTIWDAAKALNCRPVVIHQLMGHHDPEMPDDERCPADLIHSLATTDTGRALTAHYTNEQLLTHKQASATLEISAHALDALIAKGDLTVAALTVHPSFKQTKIRLYRLTDITDHITRTGQQP